MVSMLSKKSLFFWLCLSTIPVLILAFFGYRHMEEQSGVKVPNSALLIGKWHCQTPDQTVSGDYQFHPDSSFISTNNANQNSGAWQADDKQLILKDSQNDIIYIIESIEANALTLSANGITQQCNRI